MVESTGSAGSREHALVLVVDDDPALVGMLVLLLGDAGFEVIPAYDGESALRRVRDESPDLVILDLHLPRLDGDVVLRRIVERSPTPVIMLTGRSESDEKARLLDLGADASLTKPVGRVELLARVRAVLRRASRRRGAEAARVALGELQVDPIRYLATVRGRAIRLSATELRLLARLALDPGAVTTIRALLRVGWPGVREPDPALLRRPLLRLRRKLAEATAAISIENARGVGYRLVARETSAGGVDRTDAGALAEGYAPSR